MQKGTFGFRKMRGILCPAANLIKKEYALSSYVSRFYCKEDTVMNCSQHVKSCRVSLYIGTTMNVFAVICRILDI